MRQNDEQFINILNQFRTTTQLQLDVDTINNQLFVHDQMIQKIYIYFTLK